MDTHLTTKEGMMKLLKMIIALVLLATLVSCGGKASSAKKSSSALTAQSLESLFKDYPEVIQAGKNIISYSADVKSDMYNYSGLMAYCDAVFFLDQAYHYPDFSFSTQQSSYLQDVILAEMDTYQSKCSNYGYN